MSETLRDLVVSLSLNSDNFTRNIRSVQKQIQEAQSSFKPVSYTHLDVYKRQGLEPVDVVTFGSPCQDLSIAGKREGLGGGRSSLFFEAVRIIREMREATDGKYPRWAVWENVPGALSSHCLLYTSVGAFRYTFS